MSRGTYLRSLELGCSGTDSVLPVPLKLPLKLENIPFLPRFLALPALEGGEIPALAVGDEAKRPTLVALPCNAMPRRAPEGDTGAEPRQPMELRSFMLSCWTFFQL
eukprot:1097611-Rhodomonas_salina.1